MIEGPRFLHEDEFSSLIELLDCCFEVDEPGETVAAWPHLYGNLAQCCRNTIVCTDGGRVVAATVLYPAVMQVDNAVLPLAGISGVATYPEYRGLGLMTKSLELAKQEMQARGIALSWLTGDRQRYNHFGWENAGRQLCFTITERSLTEGKSDIEISPYKGENGLCDALLSIYRQNCVHIRRDTALMSSLLSRPKKYTYVAFMGGTPISYLTVQPNKRTPGEFLAFEHGGDADGLEALIKHCFVHMQIKRLIVRSQVRYSLCNRMFFDNASTWQLEQGYIEFPSLATMLNILCLQDVLTAFQSQMMTKRAAARCIDQDDVTLQILGGGQATLHIRENDILLSQTPCAQKIVLSEQEMVRLVFGISAPCDSFKVPAILNSVFPLEFSISALGDI